jgi:hypothetical protein
MTHQFWNHQGTQDSLSKVLINLASGSLLTVLVLYLVLHQGASGSFLQGDVRTKVKTPGTGKNMVGETVQTPLYPSPGFMLGIQQIIK